MTRLFVSFYLFMAVSLVLISSTLELIWPDEDYREPADMVLAKALLPLTLKDVEIKSGADADVWGVNNVVVSYSANEG